MSCCRPIAAKAPSLGSPMSELPAQTQLCDERPVSLYVLIFEVPEVSPAFADHHQQPSAAVVVLLVDLEMLGQVVDTLGEQRNLDFRRTGVVCMHAERFDNGLRVVHEGLSFAR